MLSDASAAILGALIAGIFGLAGVWLGAYFVGEQNEKERRTERLFVLYLQTEVLRNVLIAYQKKKLDPQKFYRLWNETTEKIMGALLGSGLGAKTKKRVLKAMNGKWEDAQTVPELTALANDLLERIDPDYARAAKELLNDLGVKPEDIEPIILGR